MTDAAIIALSASSATVTIVVVLAMWWQARVASDAKDSSARYQAQAATLTESNKAKDAALAAMAADLKSSKERADALDAQYQKLRAAIPVAGAYGVLSSEASSAHPGAGGSVVALPHREAASDAGHDGLLRPGE